ncbi:hypothetical protein [Secundilactobacillus kimchicus]|uniref:hypothetical protein n=1 Tax=Secundilactobacillus kimchicus TaxID=528209 RepID=UPI0024368E77|nr:hypothetical protein [Secundilactobacillus kimchicus]
MSQLIDLTGQTALAPQNAADSDSILTAYVAVVDAFFPDCSSTELVTTHCDDAG